MVGLVVWMFFSQSLLAAATSLLDQGALIRKARFPRELVPASVGHRAADDLPGRADARRRGHAGRARDAERRPSCCLPLVLAALFAFTLGLALAVAVLHAYFRDVAPILAAALLPWFFLSPIFFEPEQATGREAYRFVLEWAQPGGAVHHRGARRPVRRHDARPRRARVHRGAALVAVAIGRTLFRRLQGELAVVV
jgi:ABC-type polysaccharide/polyol phosphate export permease